MMGPQKKKMADKLVCTGCDVIISREIGGTKLYPKIRKVNFCKHKDLDTEIAFIKGFPYTPGWCPASAQENQK